MLLPACSIWHDMQIRYHAEWSKCSVGGRALRSVSLFLALGKCIHWWLIVNTKSGIRPGGVRNVLGIKHRQKACLLPTQQKGLHVPFVALQPRSEG